MKHGGKVRVLIVDDSPIARELIARGLSANPSIEVIGKAADAYSARDQIVLLTPDVITLDVEMPKMDGIEFLRRLLPQYPVPVVIVSAVTSEGSRRAIEALEAGAIDVVAKPRASDRDGFAAMIANLAQSVIEASAADARNMLRHLRHEHVAQGPKASAPRTDSSKPRNDERKLIAIGASTGGTNALAEIIPQFPLDVPGIVIVQHMPPVFTRLFAESLNRASAITVSEAKDGERIERGHAYIAPGDLHMTVESAGTSYALRCRDGEKVSGHRPSVDILFESVARSAGDAAVGVLLTGMGKDGASGLLSMRESGARCIAQDEESSVVFGMPMEAWKIGAAESLVPLERTTAAILSLIRERSPVRSAQ